MERTDATTTARRVWRPSDLGRRTWRGVAILGLVVLIFFAALPVWRHLRGQYHFTQALQAIEAHRYAEAKDHFHSCYSLWPRDPRTLLLGARIARQTNDLKQAELFQRQYRQHNGDPLDEEYLLESTLLQAQQGEVDRVLAQCQRWVEARHAGSARILETLAQSYLQAYRVPEAEVTIRIWLDRFPNDPQAIFYSGWALEHRDVPERAAEEYQRALDLVPHRDDIRVRLAASLLAANRPAEALPLLETLCRAHSDHPPTRLYLVRALYGVGRVDEAQRALEQLLEEFPNYPPALTESGRLALQQGRPAEAAQQLREAVAASPGDAQAWYLLSQTFALQGASTQAEEALARFKILERDQKRIRDIAIHELSRKPNDPHLLAEVGELMLRGGEVAEGIRWLKRALEKDPRHQTAHRLLADHYQKVGQVGLASRHRDQVQRPVREERP